MLNTEQAFKIIDDAADKVRIEKEAEWEKEFERKEESYKRVSECEFLMHSSEFPPSDPVCMNPKRSKITSHSITYFRDCLGADCPLFQ